MSLAVGGRIHAHDTAAEFYGLMKSDMPGTAPHIDALARRSVEGNASVPRE